MEQAEIENTALTDEGRETVEEFVHCYEEVSYGGEYEEEDECRGIVKSQGFEKVGSGVGRDIFAVPDEYVTGDRDCIVKFARNLVGCHESQREVRSWQRVSDEARRYLVPVLDHDVGWVLMPRAQEEDLSSHEIQELLASFTDTGWACDDTNEAHNLGRLDGDPVIIDYGMGCYQR